MAFIETRFPVNISLGSAGGPRFNTVVTVNPGGFEKRQAFFPTAIHEYDAAVGAKTQADIEALIAFFHAVQGSKTGFRWKDWTDYKSTGVQGVVADTDQTIGTGDGATTTFQLTKTYLSATGGTSNVRTITKPVAGTTVVSYNDVSQPSGWSVDTTTGIVTTTGAQATGVVIKAGFEFDVPVRFATDSLNLTQRSRNCADGLIFTTSIPVVEIRV